MNKTKLIILISSAVLSLVVVGGALLVALSRDKPERKAPVQVEQRPVTKAELAKATGKDGKVCYVAVDSTVYEIKDFSMWQNGKHKTSNGLAYCGADMTQAIEKAPHGRKMLDLLIKIGPLTT